MTQGMLRFNKSAVCLCVTLILSACETPRPTVVPVTKQLRSISLSDPLLMDFAYDLAIIDNGYLPKGSRQELAIRREIRDLYPKVTESVMQISDMTVVCVRLLGREGIKSSNYEILRTANRSMPVETRELWPMRYADLLSMVVVLTGGPDL